jgi:hypothetical protein
MSQEQIRITFTRGGREFSRRSFSLREASRLTFGQAVCDEQLTIGMDNQFELFVRDQEGKAEISGHDREKNSLESVLLAATDDGQINGKTFVIDCTAEHKGAL